MRLLFVVLVLGWLVGCSSAGRNYAQSGLDETLEVEILPNASKMFTYRLRLPEEQIPSHIRVSRDGSDGRSEFYRGGVNIGRNTHERLLENAGYVVQQVGYCREEFFVLDRSVSRYHLWLRGECKEGATDADRQAFPARQTLKAERWNK